MTHSRTHRGGLALLAALALVLMSACSNDDSGDGALTPEAEQDGDDDTADGDGGDSEGTDNGATAAGAASVEEFDPTDVLVEQTVSLPDNAEDEVTLAVQSLRVDGRIMTLGMVVTPEFSSVSGNEPISLFDIWRPRAFAPTLVDTGNLKEYSVIQDSAEFWSSDSVDTSALNGEPMLAWAVYAAPEDDIDTIDVRVAEWWPPFLDVPIER